MKKRVLILSSHPLFGQGVESLLRQETGLDIAGRETDVDKAIQRITELQPDVVIVDCDHPGCDPTPIVMRILREGLGTKVIGLNLQDNTLCIYRGEQRVVKEVKDLVEAIEHNSLSLRSADSGDRARLARSRSHRKGDEDKITENKKPKGPNRENSLNSPKKGEITMSSVEKEQKGITRRQFVKATVAGGAAGAVLGAAPGARAGIALTPSLSEGELAIPVIAEKELTCDVLVVGGGTSGFTAAVKAAKEGAKVTVIEKNPEIGGEGMVSGSNATFGGGTDYQKEAGVEDSPELYFEDMSKWDPKADPEVLKAFTENTAATCHFLRDLGVNWLYNPTPNPDCGDSAGRLHSVDGKGPALYAVMRPALEGAGGKILTETKGVKLLTDAKGAVIGVLAKDKQGLFTINSKATILTCGGFQGNVEMVTKYVGPGAVYALLRGLATNAGDGVLMGMEVRAATRAMERVHGYVHIPPYPMPYPFHPYTTAIPPDGKHGSVPGLVFTGFAHCIVVNIRGERFADESRPRLGEQMCNEILRQPEVRAYIIADKPLYDEYLKASVEGAIKGWKELGYGPPQIEAADTIEDLAKKIGISPGILSSTVSEYNKAVEEGTTHLLRVPKANKDPLGLYQKLGMDFLHKIETPPFYAVMVTAGLSHSDGGLAISGKCQVIDREKKPVPGLYAAGDTAVLWHSNYAQGYGQAHTLGYIAGKNAAAEALG